MDWEEKIFTDHNNAAFLAEELSLVPGILIDPALVETNIVRFEIEPTLLKKLRMDYYGVADRLKDEYEILCNAGFSNDNIRLVTHRDVNRKDCEKVIKSLKSMLKM